MTTGSLATLGSLVLVVTDTVTPIPPLLPLLLLPLLLLPLLLLPLLLVDDAETLLWLL